MPRLGAHMSASGGLPLAVDRAALHGCESLQLFTRSPSQWKARTLGADEIAAFRRRLAETGIGPALSHASYLINLATADATLRARSLDAFADEIDRAEALGLVGVVIHPGALGPRTERQGIRLVAGAIRDALAPRAGGRTHVLIEGTAGQGTTLGHRFEHLAAIVDALDGSPRVGVCLDTCHLFAAGFDLSTEAGFEQTMQSFDRIVGLERLRALHLNDALRECGSRIDRHAHIGKGRIGLAGFARIVRDPRLAHLPMILETPKADESPPARVVLDRCDRMNLAILRKLAGVPPPRRVRGVGTRRTPQPRS